MSEHFEERPVPIDVQMMSGDRIIKQWRLKRYNDCRFILETDGELHVFGKPPDDLKWGELCEIRRLAQEALAAGAKFKQEEKAQ